MGQRTNIKIAINNNTLEVKVEPFRLANDSFDILCRNLHTLVGIRESRECWTPIQFCYSSVVVEEVAYSYSHLFEKGDKLLIAPCLEKYFGIKDLKKNQGIIYQKGQCGIDDVDLLFFPLLCQALTIIDRIAHCENVVFLGCNLIGAVLLKLLYGRNISLVVYMDKMDISEKVIYEIGASKVIPFNSSSIPEISDKFEAIVINSYPEFMVNRIEERFSKIPVIVGKEWSEECRRKAANILREHNIHFEDIISHHEHAENILMLTEEMRMNKFNGKAIVFDW